MLEFKKAELEQVLLTICTYSAPKEGEQQRMISGLLKENLPLGAKRRLQKIQKAAQEAYKELIEDFKKVREACKVGEDEKKEPIYDQEKLKKETNELLLEVVKVDVEPIQMSLIEAISSETNYNFEIIEKFAI